MKEITAVIIGNEILAGRRSDVHLANTVSSCNARGLRLNQAIFLHDDFDTLVKTYQRLQAEDQIILSFGGIGATPDDKTRAAVAKACHTTLEFHPQGLQILADKFGDDFNEARHQLINFPKNSQLIPNPINNIPGFSIENIHCVPGFPQMATPMIAWVLDTYYLNLAIDRLYISMMVKLPESQITPLMIQLETEFPTLSISSLPLLHHELELGFEGEAVLVEKAYQMAEHYLNEINASYSNKQ